MDLRPKLARAFAEAIYDDMLARQQSTDLPNPRGDVISDWVALVMERFQCQTIECTLPDGGEAPEVVAAFRAKYPELESLIEEAQTLARQVWPKAEFAFHLSEDQEGCHTCREGQTLHMGIFAAEATIASRDKEEFEGQWSAEWAKNQQFRELLHAKDCRHEQAEWDLRWLVRYEEHAQSKADYLEAARLFQAKSQKEAEERVTARKAGA